MASCFQLLMSASLSAAECPGVDFCCPIIAEYFFPTDEMVGGLLSSLKKRAFLTSRIKFIPLSLEFKGSCHQTPIQSLLKIFAQIPLMLFGNPDPPLPSGRVCILTQMCWICLWTSTQTTLHLLSSQVTLLYLIFRFFRFHFSIKVYVLPWRAPQPDTDLSLSCPAIVGKMVHLHTFLAMMAPWVYHTPPEKWKVTQGSSTSLCPSVVSRTKV